jgi:hypothetical protein
MSGEGRLGKVFPALQLYLRAKVLVERSEQDAENARKYLNDATQTLANTTNGETDVTSIVDGKIYRIHTWKSGGPDGKFNCSVISLGEKP